MSKVILKVEIDEDYLESIKASTNKTSSDIILINATPITESDDAVSRQAVLAIAGDSCLDLDSYEDTKEFCDDIKDLPPVLPKHEGNTVSEEVYTEEYIQRKKLEYELYVLKKKISELI